MQRSLTWLELQVEKNKKIRENAMCVKLNLYILLFKNNVYQYLFAYSDTA